MERLFRKCFLVCMLSIFSLPPVLHAEESADLFLLESMVDTNSEKLDSLLDWAGYFEIVAFNKDQKNEHASFGLNRLDLFLGKQINRWKFFSQLEYDLKARQDLESGAHTGGSIPECSDQNETQSENVCETIEHLEGRIDNLEESKNIGIEALWVEYNFSNLLGIRLGKQLTPIGWWNVYHHPITVLTTSRPESTLAMGSPHEVLGLTALGSYFFGEYSADYKLFVMNDLSDELMFSDKGDNKPFGGRVKFNAPFFKRFDIGFSFLQGRNEANVNTASQDKSTENELKTFFGVDEFIKVGNFELLGEYVSVKKHAHKGAASTLEKGYYVQPSYAFPSVPKIGYVTVLYRYDVLDKAPHEGKEENDKTIQTFGVNIKPIPEIAIKMEYQNFSQPDADEEDDQDYSVLQGSLTMFF